MPEIFINESLVGISFGVIAQLAFLGVTSCLLDFNEQFYNTDIFSSTGSINFWV